MFFSLEVCVFIKITINQISEIVLLFKLHNF